MATTTIEENVNLKVTYILLDRKLRAIVIYVTAMTI